ncbi:MAG TPA: methyltransferase domain-containing protein [Vicinamibacterales bacterium]|jgi:SAM-dependent methyltransferase|nr:methyltransferase domain-containing protein [Vicinamibacterales bacterium]
MTFPWPPIGGTAQPQWTGAGFRVGGATVGVLSYSGGQSGWSDGLTHMHESWAGHDHPIDELSRNWSLAAVARHVDPAASPALLEVGCSSGFFIAKLRDAWPAATVMGSDFLLEPLERLAEREPGIPLLQFDLVRCPLPAASVDAVILLNVLEHIKDDRGAVTQVFRVLKPGGVAVVEVPAGPDLYDAYDEFLQHERRYTTATLRALLEGSGLNVVEASHLGFSVYPAFAMVKRRNQRQAAASTEARRKVVEANITGTRSSALLGLVLRAEAALGRFVSYPAGIRAVAVARKPR